MSMLHAALDFAERGWPVIPLVLDGKAPLSRLVPNGVAHATTDPSVIIYWWSRAKAANIGIACHRLLVVDVDPRNGGDQSIATLLDQHGQFAETPTARTGSGGTHYFFNRPTLPLVGKLAAGIDLVHGSRRYVVAAPSIHSSGRRYEWLTPPSAPLADAPEWLLQLATRNVYSVKASTNIEKPSNLVARATAYASKIPPAVSGQHGHDHTFATACRVARGFSLNEDEAFAALSDWNRTCSPPWSDRDLKRKIDQAMEHGDMPFGALLERKTA